LVLGDLILDRYTWGNAERISQEAPVIVLRTDSREVRLGGAGNVCNMLRGLEAEVTCAGVVGADTDGEIVRQQLRDVAVDTDGLLIDPTRPTTVKERFIGRAQGRHSHQILRVDNEVRDPLNQEIESRLGRGLVAMVAEHDVVLISDYDKGVCTPRLLRVMIDAARACGRPVLVDPIRSNDYSRYRGATTMTPNRTEAGMATGIRIETAEDAIRAGRRLCHDIDLDVSIVTLDSDGIALVTPDGCGEVFPTKPRAVYDITGAGDVVLAMIGISFASGVAPADAVRLGNIAGGLEVEKFGVAVISRDEIRERLSSDQGGHSPVEEPRDRLLFSGARLTMGEEASKPAASRHKAAA
jgi:D-beta-D-heptose 7-phosphate kinase/D-beta-D-heptose 1-phosphate adenosyltransferase